MTVDCAETKTVKSLYYTQIFGLIDKEIEEELMKYVNWYLDNFLHILIKALTENRYNL